MIDLFEIFIFSDQPTCCPKCGLRTNIILDLRNTINKMQIHHCTNEKCGFDFAIQQDDDFENIRLI